MTRTTMTGTSRARSLPSRRAGRLAALAFAATAVVALGACGSDSDTAGVELLEHLGRAPSRWKARRGSSSPRPRSVSTSARWP